MQGSLALHRGVVYVGRHAKTAEVRPFDLDGRPRPGGFTFRDPRRGRSVAAGLSVDDDRRLWVADTVASRVRAFTLFGREEGGIGAPAAGPLPEDDERDAAGLLRQPVDVAVRGDADGLLVAVASGGERRHAVQLFDEAGAFLTSLRPGGDPRGRFHGARRVVLAGRLLYVVESQAARVQVFRDGEFHFAFRIPGEGGEPLEPTALAPVADGRVVVACRGTGGGLFLCDASGHLEHVLAYHGGSEGCVFEPSDVALEPDTAGRDARVLVIDRDADRVQVFTLEGRCYGAFDELAG